MSVGEVWESVLGCKAKWGVWKNVGKCIGCGGNSLKRGVGEVCWSVSGDEERWGV